MNPKDHQNLLHLLNSLRKSDGHFIIECGEYYCQLAKEKGDKAIHFEALSHHFNEKVAKSLETKFASIGFSLEQDENYAKDIILNSAADVANTAKEIEDIFEQIYEVPRDCPYTFDDQIEATPAVNTTNDAAKTQVPGSTTYKDVDVIKALLVLGGVCLFIYFLWTVVLEQEKQETRRSSFVNAAYNSNSPKVLLKSPQQFISNFNAFARSYEIKLRINSLDIVDGEQANVFTYSFNDYMGVVGTLNKGNNSLKSISLIAQGQGKYKSDYHIVSAMIGIIASVDPSLSSEDHYGVLQALGINDDATNLYDLSSKVIHNGIQYYMISSELTGINFGAERP